MSTLKDWTAIWKITIIPLDPTDTSTGEGSFTFTKNIPKQSYELNEDGSGGLNTDALTSYALMLLKDYAYRLFAEIQKNPNCLFEIEYFKCDDYMDDEEAEDWTPYYNMVDQCSHDPDLYDCRNLVDGPSRTIRNLSMFEIDNSLEQSHTAIENCNYSADALGLSFRRNTSNEKDWEVEVSYIQEAAEDEALTLSCSTIKDIDKLIQIKQFINKVIGALK